MFIGIVFLLMALTMYSYQINSYSKLTDYLDIFFIFLAPSILLILTGFVSPTVIIVDQDGIFYKGDLITDWNCFQRVFIKEDYVNEESLDKIYYLHIEYLDDSLTTLLESRIRMNRSYNRSEEEIIAAIERIYNMVTKPK